MSRCGSTEKASLANSLNVRRCVQWRVRSTLHVSPLGDATRYSMDEKFRGQCYKEMTKIFEEQVPWIEVIQPIELYGLLKYMDWKAQSLQQIELRPFNFKFRRA